MRCFIHTNIEAIAACRRCGKGMCENCSAYSGHTGICPECRREDFIKEVAQIKTQAEELSKKITYNIVKTVFLFWTIVFIFVGIYRHSTMKEQKAKMENRIDVLEKEIEKLSQYVKTNGKEFK